MKILVFCGDPGVPIHGPSGASAHLRGFARGLSALGHDVRVAALRHSDERGRYDVPLGVTSITTGRRAWPRRLRTFGEIRDGRRLAARVRRTWPDTELVVERYSLLCDGGLRLARQLGVPHVLEVNAPLSIERGKRHRLERTLLRGTDRVVTVSGWLADWARGRGAREVRHVPNGSSLVATDVRPGPGLRLVHHGSLRDWHGLAFFPALLDHLPEAELHLVGGRLVDHPRIRCWPQLDPVPLAELLQTAHVGLLPYPADAPPWFDPLKLADYRALGVPTLGSLHPAVRSADRRVALRDPAGWAAAIRALAGVPRVVRARPWTQVAREVLDGFVETPPSG